MQVMPQLELLKRGDAVALAASSNISLIQEGWTALHYAAQAGYLEVSLRLLKKKKVFLLIFFHLR